VTTGRRGHLLRELGTVPAPASESEPAAAEDMTERQAVLEEVLRSLAPEDRVAVELYVVEEVPAATVARLLGLPNAKAVYNKVYRALAVLRARLEGVGIRRGDL